MITFYKGVLISDLTERYIPGTVTTNIAEAVTWMDRISSKKRYGASKHIKHGPACLIKIEIDSSILKSHSQFQMAGVAEHDRESCWVNAGKSKAQINQPCSYSRVDYS